MVLVTALNGRLPATDLAPVPGGHLLQVDAAASLARISAAMDAAGLGPLLLSAGRSGYRSLDDQRYMIARGLTTMPAGQSQHGEGLAGDMDGLGGYTGKRYLWLQANGRRFGWSQPAWARKGGSLPEPWHWEYDRATDTLRAAHVADVAHTTPALATVHAVTPPTPITPLAQEDDMARLIRHPNGAIALVGPGAQMRVLRTATEVDAVRATGQATGDLIQLPDPLIWDTAHNIAARAGTYTD